MFSQPLLPCRGSAVQAAAHGRAEPGCGAHMNIQWLPNISRWGPSALITRGNTHSWRHGLRRVEYSTTDYILKALYHVVVKKFTFSISSVDEFLFYYYNNRFTGLCLGLPGWTGTRRNIHPLTYPDHHWYNMFYADEQIENLSRNLSSR